MTSDGFDDLIKTLDDLGNVGKKVGKKVLSEQAEVVVEQQKIDAPKDSENSSHGADKLKADKAKSKGNTTWVHVGINSDNWEDCKHLYYQHYGYTLWKNGKTYAPNIGWMDDSFKKIESKVSSNIINDLEKEIDNIFNK